MRAGALPFALLLLLPLAGGGQNATEADPIEALVSRLSLQRYKVAIRGLTRFGDRRQGTSRNRAALDWIEEQLRSYGCANIERIRYTLTSRPALKPRARPKARPAPARGGPAKGAAGAGGSRIRGVRAADAVNNDPELQHDARLRELNAEPSTPGPREEVFCTKIGATHPEEMYIVSAHMDGIGYGEAANDDGSGTALVLELARILNAPDVVAERSIRFALWNNEETGTNGSRAYIEQRRDLQGKEDPPGSGRYPVPKWLGVIQHDMLLFDHGMPLADGTVSPHQRPEADINVEFQSQSRLAEESARLAWALVPPTSATPPTIPP